MEEQRTDEFEIDIFQLLHSIWDNILIIILAAAVFGLCTFGYTYFRITPKYKATTTLYVNSSSFSIGSASVSVSSSQLTSAKSLVSTYILVLESRNTMEKVIEEAGLNLSYSQVCGMISTEAVEGTPAFKVSVSSTSPTQAELIANTIAKVLPERIAEIIYGTSVQVIEYAIVPASSSYPNYTTSTLTGALVGAALSALCVCALDILRQSKSTVVSSSEDLRRMFNDIPIFAVIPDIRQINGKSYYYSYYGSDTKDKKNEAKKA